MYYIWQCVLFSTFGSWSPPTKLSIFTKCAFIKVWISEYDLNANSYPCLMVEDSMFINIVQAKYNMFTKFSIRLWKREYKFCTTYNYNMLLHFCYVCLRVSRKCIWCVSVSLRARGAGSPPQAGRLAAGRPGTGQKEEHHHQ